MLKKYGVCKSIIREREKPRQNEEKRTSGCKRRAMNRDEWGALRPEINWINILTDHKKSRAPFKILPFSLLYKINKKNYEIKDVV